MPMMGNILLDGVFCLRFLNQKLDLTWRESQAKARPEFGLAETAEVAAVCVSDTPGAQLPASGILELRQLMKVVRAFHGIHGVTTTILLGSCCQRVLGKCSMWVSDCLKIQGGRNSPDFNVEAELSMQQCWGTPPNRKTVCTPNVDEG